MSVTQGLGDNFAIGSEVFWVNAKNQHSRLRVRFSESSRWLCLLLSGNRWPVQVRARRFAGARLWFQLQSSSVLSQNPAILSAVFNNFGSLSANYSVPITPDVTLG